MTLDGVKDVAESLLAEGATLRESPWRHLILATVGPDGAPALRMLVLRAWDAPARRITLHTDSRSAKMANLRTGSQVALLGWDPARRIQLRLSGPIEVAGGAEAAAVWQVLPRHTRATYATALPPGTMVTDPAALPPPLTDEAAAAVFTLLHISVTQLDWLRLTHGGQERARFTWAARDAHATWIAP